MTDTSHQLHVTPGANIADGKEGRPRIAILVVKGFERRGARARQREAEAVRYPWIELCLRQISRHSQGWDYEVLVFDNSHLASHRRLMGQFERVRVLPRNWWATAGRAANRLPGPYAGRLFERRHASALDYLVSKVGEEFEYIVTLDDDSFPVRGDWLEVLVSACRDGAAAAGVYRDEMAPSLEPFIHPSGMCVGRRELKALHVSFGKHLTPDLGNRDHNQDVAQKITYEFLQRGRTIAPLRRSNKVNFHFLMGGIYGDVIYHHAAGGRRPRFHTSSDVLSNEKIGETLRNAAFADIDHLMAVLRGQAANDLGIAPLQAPPAPTQAR